MPTIQLTDEQLAIIQHFCRAKTSLRVQALAGAAKTTTIEAAIKTLKPAIGQVLAIAFNKKIADALQKRLPVEVTCATINALGHRAWGGFIKKKLNVDANKMYHIITDTLGDSVAEDEYTEVAQNLKQMVAAAKSVGLIPMGCKNYNHVSAITQDTIENWEALSEQFDFDCNQDYINFAREALKRSIERAFEGYIDFNDQIYMSTCYNGVFFQKYEIVVVDEAQDLSLLNHQMIAKCLAHGGKLIAVGDPNQSIYAFRGADTSSMEKLRERFQMDTLYLNTTFRCARAIAEHVREKVPEIKSPSWAKQGAVEFLGTNWDLTTIKAGSAIICRNNKPLMQMAYKFIKAGRPVIINGGDFGQQIISLLRKICKATSKDEQKNSQKLTGITTNELLQMVNNWKDAQVADALAKGKKYRVSAIEDKAGSLQVVIESCGGKNARDVLQELTQIFENKLGSVTLSSGHKSKGLEWETVYHLDSHLIPSRWAIEAQEAGNMGPLMQEQNLSYVISTRAKERLVYISTQRPQRKQEALVNE